MTTYPTQAMLGELPAWKLIASVAGSRVFAGIARVVWLRSIGHYTSTSN